MFVIEHLIKRCLSFKYGKNFVNEHFIKRCLSFKGGNKSLKNFEILDLNSSISNKNYWSNTIYIFCEYKII